MRGIELKDAKKRKLNVKKEWRLLFEIENKNNSKIKLSTIGFTWMRFFFGSYHYIVIIKYFPTIKQRIQ